MRHDVFCRRSGWDLNSVSSTVSGIAIRHQSVLLRVYVQAMQARTGCKDLGEM